MKDSGKTKEQLIKELEGLRGEIYKLESDKIACRETEYTLSNDKYFFEMVINSLPGIFYLVDNEGNFYSWNKNFEIVTGYSAEEIKEIKTTEFFEGEDKRLISEKVQEVFDKGKSFAEADLVAKSGAKTRYYFSGHQLIAANKQYLSGMGIDITEQKQKEEELKKFKFISDHANDAHFLVDSNAKYHYVNETACRMMGYSEAELLSLAVPDVDMVYHMAKYRELFDKIQKETVPPIQTVNRKRDGTVFCSEITVTGYKIGDEPFMFAVLRDITERVEAEKQIKKSLKEKEVLLREVHHRVKNNLSVIYSLLKLQTKYVKEERYREMFHESMDRIKSMAIIHEKLYRSDDLAEINFGDYLSDMVDSLYMSYGLSPGKVMLKKDVEKITLDINASVPCGLIVNELVSNALKHAFPEDRAGEICLSLRRKNKGEIELTVSDNGIGMPEGLDYKKSDTLGLTLVKSFVSQIGGEIELFGKQGTGFRITFRKRA